MASHVAPVGNKAGAKSGGGRGAAKTAAALAPKPILPGKSAGAAVDDTEPDSEFEDSDGAASGKDLGTASSSKKVVARPTQLNLPSPKPIGSGQLKPGTFVARPGFHSEKPAGVVVVDTGQLTTAQIEEETKRKRLLRVQRELGALGAVEGGVGPVATSRSDSRSDPSPPRLRPRV
jgi:hypothetical protein